MVYLPTHSQNFESGDSKQSRTTVADPAGLSITRSHFCNWSGRSESNQVALL